MFETLIFQYLNKLPERQIGDFASPEPFHTCEIQRLGDDSIKPSTEVCSKFEVPISALVGNISVEPCEFSNSTPHQGVTLIMSATMIL